MCEYVQLRQSYVRLSEFSKWPPTPSWMSWKWNLSSPEVAGGSYLHLYQIWWRCLKGRPSYGSLFSKWLLFAILNYYLAILDHSRSFLVDLKLVFKFRVDRIYICENISDRTFRKFGLKRLFAPQNLRFRGILTPKHFFSSSRPQKALPWQKTRSRSHRASKSVQWCGRTRSEEYTNKKTMGRTKNSDKLGVHPAHPLISICIIFCMLGGTLKVLLKFEFHKDGSRNFGAVWGLSSPFPIHKAHRLYNSLLLPHKPWYYWPLG